MQSITHRHGEGKLATKVFVASEEGINVTSVIVMGKKECVLIDCQWTRANAYRVIAEILETGLELKAIFVTHGHPDHYWGMGEIHDVFPNAKCYAPAPVITIYDHQYQAKLDEWTDLIGERNLCRNECSCLEPLEQDYIELEGERLEIIRGMGDLMWNTMVWIPSIKTLVGSDIVFSDAHVFLAEIDPEQRKLWLKDIEAIYDLDPEVVIPGHMKEGAALDKSALKFTKDYILAAEEELAATGSTDEYFYNMVKRYPYASLSFFSNGLTADVLKGNRIWDWNEDPDPRWKMFRTIWKEN